MLTLYLEGIFIVRELILEKLRVMRQEYSVGEKALRDLEMRQFKLRETLLRISGAIQVLEELLAKPDQPDSAPTPPAQEFNQPSEIALNELS